MPNLLADAISPYLRAHADNPVAWHPWGEAAFAEAAARDVPVLISIGYATCHWCHVMARESFSDPETARIMNEGYVSIKVDREEHPDVDGSYLAAASAFTRQLGWPLTIFADPRGRAFYAGTYFPPRAVPGVPAFREVLAAVSEAWRERRPELEQTADAVGDALAASAAGIGAGSLPTDAELAAAVAVLAAEEDPLHGGFGGAPKFPVAPVLAFLAQSGGDGRSLARRTMLRMGASALRDDVEGGFFRYATRADWTEPHYERMLSDNALLLDVSVELLRDEPPATGDALALRGIADGVVRFLTSVMRLPSGAFASAQDSESTIDGRRDEGGYYRRDVAGRARLVPPALDEKVLTGWNGLAVGALARYGAFVADGSGAAPEIARGVDGAVTDSEVTSADASKGRMVEAPEGTSAGSAEEVQLATSAIGVAVDVAEYLLTRHVRDDGSLVRASLGGRPSEARAALEDTGMLAEGLLELAIATGEARWAVAARALVDAALEAGDGSTATGGDSGTNASTGTGGADATGGADVADAADPAGRADASSRSHAGPDASAGTIGRGVFGAPGGGDPVLAARGLALPTDPAEGATPSGITTTARAAWLLYALGAGDRYLDAARAALEGIAPLALSGPIAFGGSLRLMAELAAPLVQLVTVVSGVPEASGIPGASGASGTPGARGLAAATRRHEASVAVVVTDAQARAFAEAGFELFEGRTSGGGALAYRCETFVCALPVSDAVELERLART